MSWGRKKLRGLSLDPPLTDLYKCVYYEANVAFLYYYDTKVPRMRSCAPKT